jgi:hypothetical protein
VARGGDGVDDIRDARAGDGTLHYAHEQVLEAYYRLARIWPKDPWPVRWQSRPHFQYIPNPGRPLGSATVAGLLRGGWAR